ncbi:hypothetical protein [Streptomyces sp. NPDC003710]
MVVPKDKLRSLAMQEATTALMLAQIGMERAQLIERLYTSKRKSPTSRVAALLDYLAGESTVMRAQTVENEDRQPVVKPMRNPIGAAQAFTGAAAQERCDGLHPSPQPDAAAPVAFAQVRDLLGERAPWAGSPFAEEAANPQRDHRTQGEQSKVPTGTLTVDGAADLRVAAHRCRGGLSQTADWAKAPSED